MYLFCYLFLKYSLQVFLNTYGIQTQTPQQVEPIQIWAQHELVKVRHALSFVFKGKLFLRILYQITIS